MYGEHITHEPITHLCAQEEEPYYSLMWCDWCDSKLSGLRYPNVFHAPTRPLTSAHHIVLNLCEDCHIKFNT